jgi:hypothetical protein
MADQPTAFRCSFWVLFLYVTLWSWAGVAAVTLIPAAFVLDAPQWPILIRAEAFGMGFAPLLTAVLVWPLILYFRTFVGRETLTGTNVLCLWSTIQWDSIRRVRPINMAGLRYLRVKSDATRWELWVPLFPADPHGFTELVAEYAGEDNLLTRELRHRFPTDDDDYSPSHGARA